jgi:AcrR family transcriptional regulator
MARQRLGAEALLDAAELLMDERGIDSVSLNEINRSSGHQNRNAVNYHFGSREAIIRALVRRKLDVVDAERTALLDHLEATASPLAARTVLEVAIGPLSRQLRTADGRRYLRLLGQLIDHPRYVADARRALAAASSMQRCAQLIAPHFGHLPPAVTIERGSMLTALGLRSLADHARAMDTEPAPRALLTVNEFTTNLVDILLAIVEAPTTIEAVAGNVTELPEPPSATSPHSP